MRVMIWLSGEQACGIFFRWHRQKDGEIDMGKLDKLLHEKKFDEYFKMLSGMDNMAVVSAYYKTGKFIEDNASYEGLDDVIGRFVESAKTLLEGPDVTVSLCEMMKGLLAV